MIKNIRINLGERNGRVSIEFNQPVTAFGMVPKDAESLGRALIDAAQKAALVVIRPDDIPIIGKR